MPPGAAELSGAAELPGKESAPATESLRIRLRRLLRRASAATALLLLAIVLVGDLVSRDAALTTQAEALAAILSREAAVSVELGNDTAALEVLNLALRYRSEADIRVVSATLYDVDGLVAAHDMPAGSASIVPEGTSGDGAAGIPGGLAPASAPASAAGAPPRRLRAGKRPTSGWKQAVFVVPLTLGEEKKQVGQLELVIDRTGILLPWLQQALLLACGTGLVFLYSWWAAIGLARRVTAPIEDMAAQARRIGGLAEQMTGSHVEAMPLQEAELRLLPRTTTEEFLRLAVDFNGLLAVLRRQANEDSLTGLPNRRSFMLTLSQQLRRAAQRGESLGLLFLDLDHFKNVNDSLGHEVGDRLLKAAATRLRRVLPPSIQPFRLGGDEFILIAPGVGSRADLQAQANHLVAAFLPSFQLDAKDLFVTVSIGIAVFPEDASNAEDLYRLIKQADTAMYAAKREGRSRAAFFTTAMGEKVSRELNLESGLHMALPRGELVLEYQPKVDLATGVVVGAEALLRWDSPDFGRVSPKEFIPLAEENGLMLPIGRFVLESACAQLALWRPLLLSPFTLAVNVSVVQLKAPGFVEEVVGLLHQFDVQPGELELELTEDCFVEREADALRICSALRALGVLIAIDDFGTGYCNFTYLQQMPVTCLKLDSVFVAALDRSARDHNVARAMLQMAVALDMDSVAEGIESHTQATWLRNDGCRIGQGFFFSRAIPAAQFTARLAAPWVYPL